MKEKPILFSAKMVQAILSGKKTQTRRLMRSEKARYAQGDLLYVRENWAENEAGNVIYQADQNRPINWKPSIHMPKAYARIFLRVTGVRSEKLHDMSQEDALAEGLHSKEAYFDFWQEQHGLKALQENPSVWVIDFEVIKK